MTRRLKTKQPKLLKILEKTGLSLLTCPLHHHIAALTCPLHHHILLLLTALSPAPPYFWRTCPLHHHIFVSKNRPVPCTTIFSTPTCPLHHHICEGITVHQKSLIANCISLV